MVGGRWNPAGSPVVYAALTFEGAILEQLVHANTGRLPSNRRVAQLLIPDQATVLYLDPAALPDWTDEVVSQRAGGEWLSSRASVALVVPSVVAQPWGWNVALNPIHPAFKEISVSDIVDLAWDPRLGTSGVSVPQRPSS